MWSVLCLRTAKVGFSLWISYVDRSVGVLVMRDRTSKSLSRTAFPDNLLSPGRPASATLGTRRLARLPQMTGRRQIAPVALASGANARRPCYRSAAYRGLPAFVFTLHGRQRMQDNFIFKTYVLQKCRRLIMV